MLVLLIVGLLSHPILSICPDSHTEDKNSICVPKKKEHGAPCTTKGECNDKSHLNCIEGICQCDSTTSIYNTRSFMANGRSIPEGVCVGKVGSNCTEGGDNAYPDCTQFASCKRGKGTCECLEDRGYSTTANKLCGSNYGESCEETKPCRDGLLCLPRPSLSYMYKSAGNVGGGVGDAFVMHTFGVSGPTAPTFQTQANVPSGRKGQAARNTNQGRRALFPSLISMKTCGCSPKYQTFDEINGICRSLVGAPCDPKEGARSCVAKAKCSQQKSGFQCECEEGHVETMEGKCQIQYGKSCSNSNLGGDEVKCDQVAELICKKDRCACLDERDVFEEERRKCVSLEGVRCLEDEDCVNGATCKKTGVPKRKDVDSGVWSDLWAGRCAKE